MARRYKTLIAILVLVLLVCVAWYGGQLMQERRARQPGRGMVLALKSVSQFSRTGAYKDSLVTWQPASERGRYVLRDPLQKAVSDKGKAVYLYDAKKVTWYDGDGNLIGRAGIEDMGLDPNCAEVWSIVGAGDTSVFITAAIRRTENGRKWLSVNSSVFEVIHSGESFQIKKHDLGEQPNFVAINPELRLVASLNNAGIGAKFIELDSGKVAKTIELPLEDAYPTSIRWANSTGVAISFSCATKPMERIAFVLLEESRSIVVDNGENAVYAADGYIYYMKGDTQLWRCKLEGQPELVYEGTTGLVDMTDEGRWGNIELGSGGEFLGFRYYQPLAGRSYLENYVVIDLLSGEYNATALATWTTTTWWDRVRR